MKAYKFRSVEQMSFVLDIIYNQRLYCADWHTLNDPLEGIYIPGKRTDEYEKTIKGEINCEKTKHKVCSLSRTYKNTLLWAHYAAGFRGFALEIEIKPVENDCYTIEKIDYRKERIKKIDFPYHSASETLAKEILLSKYRVWKYEQEIRILQKKEFYILPKPVQKIIVGSRIEPQVLEAFQIICKDKNIDLHKVELNEEGITAKSVCTDWQNKP